MTSVTYTLCDTAGSLAIALCYFCETVLVTKPVYLRVVRSHTSGNAVSTRQFCSFDCFIQWIEMLQWARANYIVCVIDGTIDSILTDDFDFLL